MPFTQLSIDILEDLDLWLPIERLYLEHMPVIIKEWGSVYRMWDYIYQYQISECSVPYLSRRNSFRFTFDYLGDGKLPYTVWFDTILMSERGDHSIVGVHLVFSYTNDSRDCFLATFQVVEFRFPTERFVSHVLMDVFPRPDTRKTRSMRGPQVVT